MLEFILIALAAIYVAGAWLMADKDAATGKTAWAWKWPLALFQRAPKP